MSTVGVAFSGFEHSLINTNNSNKGTFTTEGKK